MKCSEGDFGAGERICHSTEPGRGGCAGPAGGARAAGAEGAEGSLHGRMVPGIGPHGPATETQPAWTGLQPVHSVTA